MAWMPVKINNGTHAQAMPTYIIWVTKAPESTMVNKIFFVGIMSICKCKHTHRSNQEMYCISIKQKQAQGDPIKVKYKGRLFIVIP